MALDTLSASESFPHCSDEKTLAQVESERPPRDLRLKLGLIPVSEWQPRAHADSAVFPGFSCIPWVKSLTYNSYNHSSISTVAGGMSQQKSNESHLCNLNFSHSYVKKGRRPG